MLKPKLNMFVILENIYVFISWGCLDKMPQAQGLRITAIPCPAVTDVSSPKLESWLVYIPLGFGLGSLLPSNSSLTL